MFQNISWEYRNKIGKSWGGEETGESPSKSWQHAGNVRGISWEMMENGGPPWTPRDNQQDGGEDILQNGWKPEGMDTLFKFEISMEWGYELASLLSCKNVFRLCVCDNGG